LNSASTICVLCGKTQRAGPADHPVGVKRVGRDLDIVEGKGNFFFFTGCANRGISLLGASGTAELVLEILLPVLAFLGQGGIELVGPPADLDIHFLADIGKRGFKPALADIAPGAHHVRDDIDGQ
jgi:hypothetical protein